MNSLFDENEHASTCQLLSENSSVSTDFMFSPSRNFQNSNLEFTQSIVDDTILNENETTDLNNNLTSTNTSEQKNNNTTLLSSTEKLFQANDAYLGKIVQEIQKINNSINEITDEIKSLEKKKNTEIQWIGQVGLIFYKNNFLILSI